jgi:transposase-like protein
VPRVADVPADQEPFASKFVKPYQRRSQSLDEVFPKLFLEGLATRDFEPALRSLLGAEAPLAPSTIVRLNQQFKGEDEDWTKSSLSAVPICYLWVDGIYVKAGIGTERACLLVVIGADTTGKKHLLALSEGARESKESWLAVLRQLKARGMNEPALAIGDGALGFWAAARACWRWTRTTTLLAAQSEEYLGQIAQARTRHGSATSAGDLSGAESGGSTALDGSVSPRMAWVV